jgi:hypothetical protein
VTRVRRFWLWRQERIDLIHRCLRCSTSTTLQHSQQMVRLRSLRLGLLELSICRRAGSTNRQQPFELFRTIHLRQRRLARLSVELRLLGFLADDMLGVETMCNQLLLSLYHRIIHPLLVSNPLLDVTHEWCNHVKLVRTAIVSIVPASLGEAGQIAQVVPRNLADLLSGFRLEKGVQGYIAEDEHPHVLLAHRDIDVLDIPLFIRDNASGANIKSSFLPYLADSAIEILLVLVDLATRERPGRALFPAFDEDHLFHALVKQNGAAHWHAHLVRQEFLIRGEMLFAGEAAQERTVLE